MKYIVQSTLATGCGNLEIAGSGKYYHTKYSMPSRWSKITCSSGTIGCEDDSMLDQIIEYAGLKANPKKSVQEIIPWVDEDGNVKEWTRNTYEVNY